LGWQLRGIDKKIAALKTELTYSSTGDRDHYLAGISSLQSEKARLAQGAMGAQLESDSEHSDAGPPSVRDEDEAAATPPLVHSTRECDSDFDEDTSAADADEAHDHARDSGELIGAGITVTQKELREHFHLPLHTVAKKLGMCTTAFKKLCRRFGIAKWPHRQLRGIDKKIAALKAELNYSAVDKEIARRNLVKLEEEKTKLSQGAEWTGLGLDLEVEVCRGESESSDLEHQSSSRRVGIRNLLCDAEDDDDVDDKDGADDGDVVSDASDGQGGDDGSSGSGMAVTEEILREHFHLPLQSVAKKLGMCTTALKKLCRRFAIAKWPHRQLRGIDKKIAALKAELNYSTVDKESARRNLVALEEEKARLSRVAIGGGGLASPLSKGMPAFAKESLQPAASRKRRAPRDEPEASKSARTGSDSRTADASALDLLASVAGIDSAAPCSGAGDISNLIGAPLQHPRMFSGSVPLSRGRELIPRLQGGVLSDGLGESSGASARSTPRLEPLSLEPLSPRSRCESWSGGTSSGAVGAGSQQWQDWQRPVISPLSRGIGSGAGGAGSQQLQDWQRPAISPLLSSAEALAPIGPMMTTSGDAPQGGAACLSSMDVLLLLLAAGGGRGGAAGAGTMPLMGSGQQMASSMVGADGNLLLCMPQLQNR
jgi:hypothetical protein